MAIRVLILEPDEDVLSEIEAYFRRMTDFDCVGVTSGRRCIDSLESFRPDILVMEPSLPCESAGRILDAVGDAPGRACLPVLVLTRRSCDPNQKSHKAVAEYLIKPQSLADVVDTIRQLASQRPQSGAGGEQGHCAVL
ncbi:MAG: response regulator transcription factor [Fuerstiella sp.]|nr:response regulator transcription factor [Fuerstiella sp.]MCP4853248.1 response regulator transcription factor [Fuerstiella sp.]